MKISGASLRAAVVAVLVLASSPLARADVLPPGEKGVKNSIAIEGKLPAGKALLVGNTFYGATRATLGAPVDVAWHPLAGPMRLYMVDAAVAAKVPAVGNVDNAAEWKDLAEKGIPCSDEFSGTRTIPETEPADEIRLVFQLEATATTCKAKIIRSGYYAKDGKPVGGPGDAGQPSRSPDPAPSSSPSAPSAPSAPASPEAPPSAPRAGCASCAVGDRGPSPLAPLVGLTFVAAFVHRKKSRARNNQS